MRKRLKSRIPAVILSLLTPLIMLGPEALAMCGPGWTFYGFASINGKPSDASSGIEITAEDFDGNLLAIYVMGSDPEAKNQYYFMIHSESGPPPACSFHVAKAGERINIFIGGHPYEKNPLILPGESVSIKLQLTTGNLTSFHKN